MNLIVTLCFKKLYTILEHDTFVTFMSGLGKSFDQTVNQTTLKDFSRFLGIIFRSIVTKLSTVSLCVQETVQINRYCKHLSPFALIIPELVLENISSKLDLMVSCRGLSYDGSLSIDDSSSSINLI